MKPRRPERRGTLESGADLGEMVAIRRGDVLWICCDPSVGSEPKKTRTCVVVSNDVANHYGQAITVVPTQEFSAERAARAYMTDLRRPRSTLEVDRVANASMVMTYDRARVTSRAGRVTPETLRRIDEALTLHLALAAPSRSTSRRAG